MASLFSEARSVSTGHPRLNAASIALSPNLGYDVSVGPSVDTRTRLLDAAVHLIETKGEVGLRVRDVASMAKVTEPSIYHFFGSREGLIVAAQALRYVQGQVKGLRVFEASVYACTSKKQFIELVRSALRDLYGNPQSADNRAVRINVLGSAQSRPELARQLAEMQRVANKALAEPLAFAQDKGWVRKGVNLEMLSAWIIGQINGRVLLEIDPTLTDTATWDNISIDAVLAAMGNPPTSLKTP